MTVRRLRVLLLVQLLLAAPSAGQLYAPGDLLLLGYTPEGERVFRFDTASQQVLPVTPPFAGRDAHAAHLGPDLDLWIVFLGTPEEPASLARIDGETGETVTVSEGGVLDFPLAVAVAPDRSVYVAESGTGIVRIDPASGAQEVVLPGALVGGVSTFAAAPDGTLVVQSGSDAVYRFDPATGQHHAVSTGEIVQHVAVSPANEIYQVRRFPHQLLRIDEATGAKEVVSEGGLLTYPTYVAFDRDVDAVVFNGDVAVRIFLQDGSQAALGGVAAANWGFGVVPPSEPVQACADGWDNDGDGGVDFFGDYGCVSADDPSEREIGVGRDCDDGLDNDGDGLADFPNDPGCYIAVDSDEIDPAWPCDDGWDNDNDILIDAPEDPGCDSPFDLSESSPELPCDNGVDDDGDLRIDLADYGCPHPLFPTESPACDDGVDNDGDGGIDWGNAGGPADPQCTTSWKQSEERPRAGCGLGGEFALLLLLLPVARRSRAT